MISPASQANAVSSGDFNGDGVPDLVFVEGSFSPSLHVLLGRGDGTFYSSQDISLPQGICGTCSITILDLNRDGRLDLTLSGSNTSAAQVAALIGNGDGTFQQPIVSVFQPQAANYPVLSGRMGAGDINGDGYPDLVIADLQNSAIYVLLGDGHGNFSLSATLFGNLSIAIYLADLNEDGKLDIVTSDPIGADALVFLGNGDGSFQNSVRYSVGGSAETVLLADMDGDGRPDLIAVSYPGNILVAKGLPNGTFSPFQIVIAGIPSNALITGVGDYNGDGIPDLLVQNAVGLGVFLGQGGLQFGPMISTLAAAFSVDTLAQGDFNRDGHQDLILGVDGGVIFLAGNGDGTFQSGDFYDIGHSVGAIAVADFNHDGRPDIAVSVPANTPRLLLGTGSGAFSLAPDPNSSYSLSGPGSSLAAGDFNGDGKVDLAIQQYSGVTDIVFGDGKGNFSAVVEPANASSYVADFNNDHRSDMVSISTNSLEVDLGEPGGAFTSLSQPLRNPVFARISAVGDVNKDGKADLLVGSNGILEIWLGNGDGTFTYRSGIDISSLRSPANDHSTVLADLDGDGHVDLILAPYLTDVSSPPAPPVLSIFHGVGDGTFTGPTFVSLSHRYEYVTAADVNQDGKPDLILHDQTSIAVLINKGGQFEQEEHYVAGSWFSQLVATDVNGDGYPDLVAVNASGTTVAVLLNQPDGTTTGTADFNGALAVVPEPSDYTAPVTITFTASPLNSSLPTPTGSVSFLANDALLGTSSLVSGQATYTGPINLVPGTYNLSAQYGGDQTFRPGVVTESHVISPPVIATQTVLIANANTFLTNQTLHLSATVTAPGFSLYGAVIFTDNGTPIGSKTLSTSPTVVFDTSLLGIGTHILSASYQGATMKGYDNVTRIFTPSTAASVTVNVTATPTLTQLSPSTTSLVAGTVVTFTATVSSASGTPFGGVTFLDGNAILGTISLLSDGTAQFSTASLAIGNHSITARYNANASFASSTSQTINVSVVQASTVPAPTFTALMQTDDSEQIVFAANIESVAGTPEGTVTFIDNGSILGTAAVATNGTAVLRVSTLNSGQHALYASYSGNESFAPSVSPRFELITSQNMPQLGLSLASLGPGKLQVSVSSSSNQSISLTCGEGLPEGYRCTFTPPVVNGTGTSRLLISAAPVSSGKNKRPSLLPSGLLVFSVVLGGCSLRSRQRLYLPILLIGVVLGGFWGCGSSNLPVNSQHVVVTVQANLNDGTVRKSAQILVQLSE